jgi:hypothetical protein
MPTLSAANPTPSTSLRMSELRVIRNRETSCLASRRRAFAAGESGAIAMEQNKKKANSPRAAAVVKDASRGKDLHAFFEEFGSKTGTDRSRTLTSETKTAAIQPRMARPRLSPAQLSVSY